MLWRKWCGSEFLLVLARCLLMNKLNNRVDFWKKICFILRQQNSSAMTSVYTLYSILYLFRTFYWLVVDGSLLSSLSFTFIRSVSSSNDVPALFCDYLSLSLSFYSFTLSVSLFHIIFALLSHVLHTLLSSSLFFLLLVFLFLFYSILYCTVLFTLNSSSFYSLPLLNILSRDWWDATREHERSILHSILFLFSSPNRFALLRFACLHIKSPRSSALRSVNPSISVMTPSRLLYLLFISLLSTSLFSRLNTTSFLSLSFLFLNLLSFYYSILFLFFSPLTSLSSLYLYYSLPPTLHTTLHCIA